MQRKKLIRNYHVSFLGFFSTTDACGDDTAVDGEGVVRERVVGVDADLAAGDIEGALAGIAPPRAGYEGDKRDHFLMTVSE